MGRWGWVAAGVGLGAGAVLLGAYAWRRVQAARAGAPGQALPAEGTLPFVVFGRYKEGVSPSVVLPVRLGPAGGVLSEETFEGLVDTGAGISAVPPDLAERLSLPKVGEVTVRGVTGTARVPVYAAEVEVGSARFVEEMAGTGEEILIGRPLLNRWVMLLDGPRGWYQIAVSQESPAPSP